MKRGLELCRKGSFEEGLPYLVKAFDNGFPELPETGVAATYLGFALATRHGRVQDGIKICERGIEMDLYDVEGHKNMARLHIHLKDRNQAVKSLDYALKIEPEDKELLAMRESLGTRQPPILAFMPRDHWLNRFLGSVRHGFRGK